MSVPALLYFVVAGAAAIALWILVRFAGFGPRSLSWAGVHAVLAFALLRLAPYVLGTIEARDDDVVFRYAAVFGVALPLFIYGFLSGGWVTRVAIGLLRR